MTRNFLISVALLLCYSVFSQKYNFVNWTVEDGLIQSQASSICQDNYRQLWIGTEGGISKFDGKKFTGYTVQEGLIANPVNVLSCDKAGHIWIGTNYGLSVFNGKTFTSIKLSSSPINNITAIVNHNTELTLVLTNFKLYSVNNFKSNKLCVSGDTTEKISTVFKTKTSEILAYVVGKGIYIFQKKSWHLLVITDELLKKKFIHTVFITSSQDTLLASNTGLYCIRKNKIILYHNTFADIAILCIAEDQKKNIWLGADNGVFKLEGNTSIHFDSKSGFTDNSVNYIYKDIENNLWFATDADGIYKFRENTFTYYDKSSGLSNTIIMGVTQTTDGHIYAAGYGGGLYTINARNDLEPAKNEIPVLINSKINCLYADDENNVWMGTIGKGVWKYNEKKGAVHLEAKNNPELIIRSATSFLKDKQGNLLIGSNQGLFIKDKNDAITKVRSNVVITSLRQFATDTVIAGTSKGIYLLDKNYKMSLFNIKELDNASVLCLAKDKENVWIGTTDKGVLNWNFKTGKIISYNTTNGLPSNFIYSICIAEKQKAWIGTGFGISNLQLDDNNMLAIKNYGRSDGLLGMECSHNCVLKAADSSLWFGTTKGLFHFTPSTDITEKNQPFVLLRSVKLFSSEITDSTLYKSVNTWFKVPDSLKLRSSQNHLTFELGAIYFTNPEDVLYKYKLEGIDKDFTTSGNPYIVYPALPPGKYTLRVFGVTKSGVISTNKIDYTFEIEKAFYQGRFFQLFIVLLLIASGGLTTYFFTRGRQKRKQKAKETLEKIREEEFAKLRQRTAEDFHDEMGNSLTRISVLTDVLRSKIDSKESDVSKLVQQIKENTNTLYNGSRDIIWSLNSQNDGMYEIAEHIKDIGNEMFQETTIDFNYVHNIKKEEHLKLKLDYSRNLTMIFKEVYNNILKHSKARRVDVLMSLKNTNELHITIVDHGQGFDPTTIKNGNGIKNMNNRVNRLGGEILMKSIPGEGTGITIFLKNSFI